MNSNMFNDLENINNLNEFQILDDLDAIDHLQAPRQSNVYLRDIMDPFTYYSEQDFRYRYRFSKSTTRNVLVPILGDGFDNMRGLPISLEMQILIALRFYATGSIQIVCGDLHYISQPTVSRIIKNVSAKLAIKVADFVKFTDGIQDINEAFFNAQSRYPGLRHIRGAIDCTHIKIKRPRGITHSEAYRNRKGYFSINTQCVVGPDMRIYDIVARWPGSSHDSRIFRNSRVYAMLEAESLQDILVGDSGYRAAPYMLTPFINPTTQAQIRYNYVQVRTRNIVERGFGVLKKVFACLQIGMATKLTTASNIIVACAVLHNIRIDYNKSNMEEDVTNINPVSEEPRTMVPRYQPALGLAFRNSLLEQYYNY